ncbi:MAG TPA: hypothetical protein VGK04_01380 [Thermoanaerobaculia bacterium]
MVSRVRGIHFSFFIALLLIAAPGFGRGLVVSPTQLGLVGKGGTIAMGVLTVASSRAEDNDVRVAIRDFTRGEDGRLKIAEADSPSHPRSCKEWLTVDRSSFVSPSSGRVELPVRARIPDLASGSYWAAILVASAAPPRSSEQGYGLQIVPQIAIPIIVTVSGTEHRDVRLISVRALRNADGAITAEALVENRGNAAVILNGAMSIDERNEELVSSDIPTTVSLPDSRSRIVTKLNYADSIDGKSVHAILRYGPKASDVLDGSGRIETVAMEAARSQ